MRQINKNNRLTHFENTTDSFITQIDNILKIDNVGLSAYILITCLIDTMATYSSEEPANNKKYKIFIKTYLGDVNPKYKNTKIANIIYEAIRCSLVHSFTISKNVLLGEKASSLHLSFDKHNNLIVDLKSFYKEVGRAKIKLFKAIKSDENLKKTFSKEYTKNPCISVYKTIDKYDDNTLVLSGSTSTNIPMTTYKIKNIKRT